MTMSDEKLLPCLCGSTDLNDREIGYAAFAVECKTCGVSSRVRGSRPTAHSEWNAIVRAPSLGEEDLRAALRKIRVLADHGVHGEMSQHNALDNIHMAASNALNRQAAEARVSVPEGLLQEARFLEACVSLCRTYAKVCDRHGGNREGQIAAETAEHLAATMEARIPAAERERQVAERDIATLMRHSVDRAKEGRSVVVHFQSGAIAEAYLDALTRLCKSEDRPAQEGEHG